jgi:hypothetical protein
MSAMGGKRTLVSTTTDSLDAVGFPIADTWKAYDDGLGADE